MDTSLRPQVAVPGPRIPRRRGPLLASGLLLTLLTAGCPRRFDPRAEEIHSPRPEAEQDYQQARKLLAAGQAQEADQALRRFAERYERDPLQPQVTLLRARAALSLGEPVRARELLQPLLQPGAAIPPAAADRARYLLGLASYRLGEFAAARDLLRPFADQIVESDDGTELHAVLADLARRDGQLGEALREFERYYRGTGATKAEQAYVREQVRGLVGSLAPEEAQRVRQRFDLPQTSAQAPAAPGAVIGVVVPLRGKDRALGEHVLRGALWGAGLLDAPALPGAPAAPAARAELRVRDSSLVGAAQAVRELAQEGVVALIGPPNRADAEATLAAAEERGLAVLDLHPGRGGAGSGLGLLRSNGERVRALVRHALGRGVRSVAVLSPQSAFGKAMTAEVAAELVGKPARLVGQLSFPEGATTFTQQAKELLALRPEALVLPVAVAQLELIAAQLATSGVIPTQDVRGRARGQEAPPVGLVLATADGLSERLLRNAGRYLQGAVLAPLSSGGVQCDDQALCGPAARFQRSFGEEPGALDALGHDAARLIIAGFQTCAAAKPAAECAGAELSRVLRGLRLDGTTGSISFDVGGQRSGPPLLLRIEGTGLRTLRPASARVGGRTS